jgi:macrodomain Ter protein organizer (MatP/YcbG family)
MDTKLTLKLEQSVIEKAKDYAKRQKTSLSRLIENYLLDVTDEENPQEKITPLVRSLSGIIDLPDDYDHKKDYADYLAKKYK